MKHNQSLNPVRVKSIIFDRLSLLFSIFNTCQVEIQESKIILKVQEENDKTDINKILTKKQGLLEQIFQKTIVVEIL